MTRDQLTIREVVAGTGPANAVTFGSQVGELVGEIVVHDARAYTAVVTEGAIGLGRGFIEGWWTSPDPVTAVRVIIRNLTAIDDARNRAHRLTGWATDRWRAVLPRRGRAGNRDDIAAHYDLGNAFFELFLDETMTYSSAVFESMGSTLAEASRHKYDVLLAKLAVGENDRLLEIGTGWGGLALRAAETIGCHVTTTTISAEQLAEARRRVDEAGHDQPGRVARRRLARPVGILRSGHLDRDDRSGRLARLRGVLHHHRTLPEAGWAGGDPGDLPTRRTI